MLRSLVSRYGHCCPVLYGDHGVAVDPVTGEVRQQLCSFLAKPYHAV